MIWPVRRGRGRPRLDQGRAATGRLHQDRGSISVVSAAVMVLAAMLSLAGVDVASALRARSQAQTAADAAALAAAQELAVPTGRSPSDLAADYATRNGATLVACDCAAGSNEAVVEVEVQAHLVVLGGDRTVRGRARAVVDLAATAPDLAATARDPPADRPGSADRPAAVPQERRPGPPLPNRPRAAERGPAGVGWPAMPNLRGLPGIARAAPPRSAPRGPGSRGTGSRGGHAARGLGLVDYTLAKRALLRNFRSGMLSRPDICDAHPELLRAARYLGEGARRPCPVCEGADLRLLAYVYADGLRTNNGRAFAVREALRLAAGQRGGACYVVEVCIDCSWNHLAEAFLARTAG